MCRKPLRPTSIALETHDDLLTLTGVWTGSGTPVGVEFQLGVNFRGGIMPAILRVINACNPRWD